MTATSLGRGHVELTMKITRADGHVDTITVYRLVLDDRESSLMDAQPIADDHRIYLSASPMTPRDDTEWVLDLRLKGKLLCNKDGNFMREERTPV